MLPLGSISAVMQFENFQEIFGLDQIIRITHAAPDPLNTAGMVCNKILRSNHKDQ